MSSSPTRSLRQALIRPRHLALTCLTLACGWAHALTVVGVAPQSRMGEPFAAALTITDMSDDQLATLSVSPSVQAAYQQAQMRRDPALDSVQTTVVRTAPGSATVEIKSRLAIQAPTLDLMVDIQWSGGGMTQTFQVTLLKGQATSSPAQSTAPSAASSAVVDQPNTDAASVVVARGDTLSELMISERYGIGTLAQRMIATQRSNPQAFIRENINWVRAGAQLSLPTRQAILAIDPKEAQALVLSQMQAFDAHRRAIAEKANLLKESGSANQGSVEQAVVGEAPEPQGDRLALSQSEVAAEAKIAEQKALAAGAAREKELQANLKDLDNIAKTLNVELGASADKASDSSSTDSAPAPTEATGISITTPQALAGANAGADTGSTSSATDAPAEPKWMTQLKSQPMLLPVVGMLLALLALWVWLRRGKTEQPVEDTSAQTTAQEPPEAVDVSPEQASQAPTLSPIAAGPLSGLLPDIDLELPNLDDQPLAEPKSPDGEQLLTQAKQALRDNDKDLARDLANQALAFDDPSIQVNAKAFLERL